MARSSGSFTAALVLFSVAAAGAPRGAWTVGPEGVLLRDGQPYRGIGFNYFDAFYHLLKNPDDKELELHFQKLSEKGIPFVRFAANGFWPVDNKLYRRNKKQYFRLLDRVVRAAEESGVGLIPSLFWHFGTIPDMAGEPVSAWGDPKSRTHKFMRTYTQEVVRRYRRSPAILAWEFGNEYNDHVDLPKLDKFRAAVVPHLGTAAERSERDDLTTEMLLTAYSEFAKTVRSIDPERVFTSGNNITRENADARNRGSGAAMDSRNAWTWMLLKQNEAFPVLSAHLYMRGTTFFRDQPVGVPGVIRALQRIAFSARKPLFLGEFGPVAADRETGVKNFHILLEAIESSGVPVAAVWNYSPRRFGDGINWNVSFDNENAWILEEVAAANERMRIRTPSVDQ